MDMLSIFDNETEKGKLFISYPMVESLRHIVDYDTFYDLTVKCKGINCQSIDTCSEKTECLSEPNYKQRVASENIPQLNNLNKYTLDTWKQLIKAHLFKMNFIVNDKNEYPCNLEPQLHIFKKQLEKYINKPCPRVSVLCAFPIFILDYYGNEKTRDILN